MEISVGAYWAMIAITKSGLNDFRAAHMACCAIHKDHRVPSFHARHSMSDIRCPTFDARHSMPDHTESTLPVARSCGGQSL